MVRKLLSLAAIVALTACQQTDTKEQETTAKESEQTVTQKQMKEETKVKIEKITNPSELEVLMRKARVERFDFEGGFYGIVTDKGDKWLPLNLETKYQQHGAIIMVSGKPIKDMITTKQWGTPFKITKIELVTAGETKKHADK